MQGDISLAQCWDDFNNLSMPVNPMYLYVHGGPYFIEHHSEAQYDDADGTIHSEGDPEGFVRLVASARGTSLHMRPMHVYCATS